MRTGLKAGERGANASSNERPARPDVRSDSAPLYVHPRILGILEARYGRIHNIRALELL